VVLLGGEPGIGKSTLLLQLALRLEGLKTLYVSGEESEAQIRMRASRLGLENQGCYILNEIAVSQVIARVAELKPHLVIVDSIQTLQSEHLDSTPGSISQIRESAAEMQRMAKTSGIPVMLIGHITKDGNLAGPKLLEHMVDTVLSFEGDQHHGYRIIRSMKNRFGSTSELAIYEMTEKGLREVSNPSEILLSTDSAGLSGVAVGACIEGLRPLLTEAQALVTPSAYGTPQRTANGFDLRRLHMLLAVLDKRGGFRMGNRDVFLNITGGLRLDDPAADLAVVAALLSSHADAPIPPNTCFAGEVGLSGEIRHVGRMAHRISEAARLGFTKMFIPSASAKGVGKMDGMEIVKVDRISVMIEKLF
jgi:DNA repair protein RadA/Sms